MTDSPRFERRIPYLAGIAVILPLPILVWFMSQHALLVPFRDDFDLVPLIQKMNAHTLTFSDLMAPHNEHRIFFPQLLMLTMAAISHWQLSWEIVTNLVLALLSFALLLKLLWQTFTHRPVLRWALAAMFSWIVFSPDQWENWLWGWQLQWFMTVLALLVTVTLLSSAQPLSKTRLGIAAAAATVADYSLASGVLAWVAGLIVLFCRGERAVWKWAWTILGVLIAAPYYYHYHSPKPSHGSITFVLHHPVLFLKYLLGYLGGPLSGGAYHAGVAAIVVALAFVTSCAYIGLRHRDVVGRLAPWISLAMFAAVSAALTAEGRLKLGVAQALSTRYTTIASLLVLATVVVTLVALEKLLAGRPQLFSVTSSSLVVLVSALVVGGYISGIKDGERFPAERDYVPCLRATASPQAACVPEAYPPSPLFAFQQIEYLRRIHWAGF